MIIPWQALSTETLNNLIEAFVLREGTDYGEHEHSLQQKTDSIHKSLSRGEVVLVWSELHQSVNIMTSDQFNLPNAPEK